MGGLMLCMILTRLTYAVLFAILLSQSGLLVQIDSATAVAAASGISRQVSTQEWLGPLSAIALSPFFGLACLSGVATYGPNWLQSRSSLLGESSPLNNPMLFWLMLGLTVVTSLPRFTKVTKPFAMAVEKLEMASAVIILIAMKFLSGGGPISDPGILQAEGALLTAGIATLPLDVVLSVAAALNIIIVNTIKLSIEVLVWLIPFPAVDAILELCNKSICASLMALYAYRPLLATAVNLSILGFCCLVFFQVRRRLAYTKEIFLRPLIDRILGRQIENARFIGFLAYSWNGLPARSAMTITRIGSGDGVKMQYRGWLKNLSFDGRLDASSYRSGLVCDQVTVQIDKINVPFDVRKGLQASVSPDFSLVGQK